MNIRKYRENDCPGVYQLFHDTVHSINTKDYNGLQIEAWAASDISQDYLDNWCRPLLESHTLVVVNTNDASNENDEMIVAFGNITRDGYLDRLYVHKDHNGSGIGSLLINQLEAYALGLGLREIVTHASITARPFLEKRGYLPVREQKVERNGQELTNYIMKKIINKTK